MHQSEMGKQKGTKTSNNASENFPCGSCKLNCKNYCINCFKCNLLFHVACKDLSHENFVALDKINGAFWACVACRAKVIGHQNNETESLHNFQQSVAGIRDDLQKEITEFKSEMLNNIEEIKLTLKNSRYENEPQKITEKLRVNCRIMMMSNSKLKADNVFIKPFLSKNEWEKEKQALEYRYKLAQNMNTNRSDIKIRSARLFFRNKMIDTNLSIEENSRLLTNSPDFS